MARLLLALVLTVCACAVAEAGWHPAGGDFFYWLTLSGQSDGYLYKARRDHYGSVVEYQNLGDYKQFVQQPVIVQSQVPVPQAPQSPQPALQTQQYQQQSAGYGEAGYSTGAQSPGWRAKLLEIAQARDEQRQYMEAISALGIKGVYGVDSPAGTVSNYSAQFGGAYQGVKDLPVQQGNSIYGSLDPSYNALADPFRAFDVGAALNQLGSLASQVEVGSSRVRSDFAQTLTQTTESYRLIRETEARIAGLNEQMRIYAEAIKANSSHVQRTDAEAGQESMRLPMRDGSSPGQPPPPFDGATVPRRAGIPLRNDTGPEPGGPADHAGKLVSLIGGKCLRCHGGADTKPGQKVRLGEGKIVNISSVGAKLAERIWSAVSSGDMPPGGGLPAEEKAVFGMFFGPSESPKR